MRGSDVGVIRFIVTGARRIRRHFRARAGLLLVALVAGQASAAEPTPRMPDGWSDGYAYVNGIRLHYYRAVAAQEKPVMVMFHGVTDNGLCWATLTSKFQDAYDVYMVDARGHGLSDPFTSEDDRDTMVKDAAEFVRAMKFERPILVGHSMGAATVMRVGAEHPDLARAIVMLDPFLSRGGPGGGGGPRNRATTGPARPAATQTAGTRAARNPSTAPDRLSFEMAGPPEMLVAQNNYRFEDLVATGRRQFPKWDAIDIGFWALAKKQYHGAYTPQAWQAMSGTMSIGDSLSKISVPALVLKADAPADARKANEEAARAMQKGLLVHIEGGGHNLHHDELGRTVEAMRAFLSTVE